MGTPRGPTGFPRDPPRAQIHIKPTLFTTSPGGPRGGPGSPKGGPGGSRPPPRGFGVAPWGGPGPLREPFGRKGGGLGGTQTTEGVFRETIPSFQTIKVHPWAPEGPRALSYAPLGPSILQKRNKNQLVFQ